PGSADRPGHPDRADAQRRTLVVRRRSLVVGRSGRGDRRCASRRAGRRLRRPRQLLPERAEPRHGQACRKIDPGRARRRIERANRAPLPAFRRCGHQQRRERRCGLVAEARIRCEASENVRRAIWYKLWGNATINPMSALTRSTADKLLDDPVIRALMARAMDELAAVGAEIDCPISETSEDRMAVTARLGAFKSSML